MLALYIVASYAARAENKGIHAVHGARLQVATSQNEAVGKELAILKQDHPPSDGWGDYSIEATLVTSPIGGYAVTFIIGERNENTTIANPA